MAEQLSCLCSFWHFVFLRMSQTAARPTLLLEGTRLRCCWRATLPATSFWPARLLSLHVRLYSAVAAGCRHLHGCVAWLHHLRCGGRVMFASPGPLCMAPRQHWILHRPDFLLGGAGLHATQTISGLGLQYHGPLPLSLSLSLSLSLCLADQAAYLPEGYSGTVLLRKSYIRRATATSPG